ncbi:polyphosphate polymerase domain-containing protein [Oerskovia sp. NPDC060287]|uniref:polyphosphate polymerase domain-containing protein n=1 Tax=Oerskovia sp. NPDC060287 TaxID=3347095 RepID=UPI003657F4CA
MTTYLPDGATSDTLAAPHAGFSPISLDELVESASLQTRIDRKYVLHRAEARTVLADLVEREPGVRVLDIDGRRDFAYESVYFDTPDLTSYHLAAHRRRRRFKVRTRTYLDSGEAWLEVKTRAARGSTVKERVEHEPDARCALGDGRRFVSATLDDAAIPAAADLPLSAGLVTRYRRTTLFLPGNAPGAPAARATLDTDLTWLLDEGTPAGRSAAVADLVVVETKTGSTPSCLDHLLWRSGHRPQRISKYGTGLAVLRPDLPGTPWRRVIRRYVEPSLTTSHDRST